MVHRSYMQFAPMTLGMLLIIQVGCSHATTSSKENIPQPSVITWPDDWEKFIGQTVTVEGVPGNAKSGAVLQGDGDLIWIDEMNAWPEAANVAIAKGKRIRITGTVIRRDDMPAFVQKDGEPQKSGVPVQSEADLPKAKRRYLLANVTWKLID